MQRKWAYILAIALFMTLVSADVASAKKHRSGRKASRSQVKRASHRGRASREVSRRQKRSRGRYAARSRRGRHLARSRRNSRVRYEPQAAVTPSTPRTSPGIPPERAGEIQGALIKAGYMDGPASGLYDEATIEAMKKFQAANGMSQTGLPSAHLLKKLGVPKRPSDGYAVPVNSVSQSDKKRSQE